jgi:hypothetical protein
VVGARRLVSRSRPTFAFGGAGALRCVEAATSTIKGTNISVKKHMSSQDPASRAQLFSICIGIYYWKKTDSDHHTVYELFPNRPAVHVLCHNYLSYAVVGTMAEVGVRRPTARALV